MPSRIRLPRAPGPGPMVIDAAAWDELCDAVEWLSGLSVGKPLAKHDTPTGPIITAKVETPPPGLWVKATSNDDGDPCKHAWTEQSATAAGGWSEKTGGRTGTLTNTPLVAADGSKLDDGTVAWAIPVTADDGKPQVRTEATQCTPDPDGDTTLDVVTNVTWDAGGNGLLEKTMVTMTIDSCGQITLGAPTTTTVDTPEDCNT